MICVVPIVVSVHREREGEIATSNVDTTRTIGKMKNVANGSDGQSEGSPNIRLYEDESSRTIGIASIVTFMTACCVLGSVPFMIRNANARRTMMRNRMNSEKEFRNRVNRERENMRRFMNERERARRNGYPNRDFVSKGRLSDVLHFQRLGLDPSKRLLRSDLKAAYQTQAMKWHPDRLPFPESDENQRKRHEEEFKRISNSYQHLLKKAY